MPLLGPSFLVAIHSALLGAVSHAQEARAPDLATELERAVDQPTEAARHQAAISLASRCASRLPELIAAAKGFGRFEPMEAGTSAQRVALQVGSELEETELVLRVPPGYDPARPWPVVLAFHGTGGRGADMVPLWSKVADEVGAFVLAPSEAGPNEGYRFSERERRAALAALRWLRRRANVDENAVFATGVSRGGHLAWDLALRYPDLFAGIAPMIGSPRVTIQNGWNNLRYVENVAHLPIRDLQGENDNAAMVWCVQRAFERLKALKAKDAQLLLQPGLGHSFEFGAVDWKAFLSSARRDPHPEKVVRVSAREREGRAFWIEVRDYSPSIQEEFTPQASQLKVANMSDQQKLAFLADEADKRTSRIAIQRSGVGKFSAQSDGVKRYRLLFAEGDFDPRKDVEVRWNGDTLEKRVRANPTTLLEEFVERFDRAFVPVAELDVR